ncbi:sensor histidine kinase [Rhizobium bangladeshense]|uniref:sensor histidine kinase n=1 Tax=Rhizobium bangladeshense TaxID=1138189 RepID=UPI001C906487|nr:HAMP domain-containing sensor histidine kinase [Rhizobium bangladeshense]MBY3598793.1 HAMP domain-containing histidine kinase [Rhizobium bangladeshense]
MTGTGNANPSLWWRLSWQLSLVFVAVVTAVIIGLCFYAASILSPNVALEDHITAVLAPAVALDSEGRLEIEDTPELEALKQEYDGLWYVAATTNGSFVSYGAIPAAYSELAPLTHLFEGADIRGSDGTDEIASVESVETTIGQLRVLFGGVADKGWPVFMLMGIAYPIYIPLLAIALPAVFLAVPRIVGRGLASVSEAARKASEIEPRRYDARLPLDGIPREVAPLVIAFNEALDRLENEHRKRQHFLIDAAHELRTPIAIMQTRIDGTAEGQNRRRLLDDVARLAETAEQLLDFERNDQATDLHETVDLVAIARGVVADLAPIAIGGGYQISFQSEVASLNRQGSPSALPRAVSNLVRNSIDHGGGSGMITVSVSAAGGGRISVADEGPGIAAEHRDLVFEPFYRVTPKSKGAGLGLSLVKQIVLNHGGEVHIESRAAGTEVVIRLG